MHLPQVLKLFVHWILCLGPEICRWVIFLSHRCFLSLSGRSGRQWAFVPTHSLGYINNTNFIFWLMLLSPCIYDTFFHESRHHFHPVATWRPARTTSEWLMRLMAIMMITVQFKQLERKQRASYRKHVTVLPISMLYSSLYVYEGAGDPFVLLPFDANVHAKQ